MTQYEQFANSKLSKIETSTIQKERVRNYIAEDVVNDDEINEEAGFRDDMHPINDKFDEEVKVAQPQKKVDKTIVEILGQIKQARDPVKDATIDDLNKLIDGFVMNYKNGEDFTPLLLTYDQLASKTKFQLPAKAILQQDQANFIETIKKLRQAQKVEISWLKKRCMEAYKEIIDQKVHAV